MFRRVFVIEAVLILILVNEEFVHNLTMILPLMVVRLESRLQSRRLVAFVAPGDVGQGRLLRMLRIATAPNHGMPIFSNRKPITIPNKTFNHIEMFFTIKIR